MKNPRKKVNAELKKEAAYFGDIVILPFMDRYELVVLKTMAICEFGVSLFFQALKAAIPLTAALHVHSSTKAIVSSCRFRM